MEYITLSLRLRIHGERLRVTAEGPNGEWAEHEREDPLVDENAWLQELREYVRNLVAEPQDTFEIGQTLSNILFPEPIRKVFYAVRQRTFEQTSYGLQIRLHFVMENWWQSDLFYWPWETLVIDKKHLVMDSRISIVRTFDQDTAYAQPVTNRALDRILLVRASPSDFAHLNLQQEFEQVQFALQPRIDEGKLEVDLLNHATLDRLEAQLRSQKYDVVHLAAYAFEKQEKSGIILEGNDGKSIEVNREQLAEILHRSEVRLVTINTNAAASLVNTLMSSGIPTVISHHYLIPDSWAIDFASNFYQALAENKSLDESMFLARRGMAKNSEDSWTSPVLSTRALSGGFWASESSLVVESVIRNGRLVTETKESHLVSTLTVNNSLQNAIDYQQQVKDIQKRAEVDRLLSNAQDALEGGRIEGASRAITSAQTTILAALRAQEEEEEQEKQRLKIEREDKARNQSRSALMATGGTFFIVGVLAYCLQDTWRPELEIPVIGLPLSVLVWSLLGGVAAMLDAFVITRKQALDTIEIQEEWILWRPIVAVFMGSVVYLLLNSGLIALGQQGLTEATVQQTPYLIWTLAFLGGFSDRFTSLIFNNIVRNVTRFGDDQVKDEPKQEEKE